MYHNFPADDGGQSGFTLIELLVVILVVGVLATLAVPAFLSERSKGQDACAKAMVRQMHSALVSVQTATPSGTYAGATTQSLADVEPAIANGQCGNASTVQVGATEGASGNCVGTPTSSSFCVAATSASATSFALAGDGSVNPPVLRRTCSEPGSGGCLNSGLW